MTYNLGPDAIDHLAYLVHAERPDWDEWVIRSILQSHALQVNGTDLSIAALRCARNPDMPGPKAIGWRGPHWRDLATVPPKMLDPERCDVCGKPEPDCWSQRPGRGDDHVFSPVPRPSKDAAFQGSRAYR